MSLTGSADGEPGAGPQKVGVAVADLMTGMYAVTGILAALRHAEATGQGQHIDLALLDTQVGWLANQALNYLVSGDVPRRMGSAHPNIVPYQVMPAADGHFMLAVGNDAQFQRLCALLDRVHWAADPRYASNAARVTHRQLLIDELSAILQQKPLAWWLAELQRLGIPAAPVNALDQVFADPQVQARGMRLALQRSNGDTLPQVANPLRLSATPIEYPRAPPLLGADTRELLTQRLGLDAPSIDALLAAGVIGVA
jgi:crotonobetainyl-CoA:carnitine CoA-transferase CaiB-like acyl-CoA transferase